MKKNNFIHPMHKTSLSEFEDSSSNSRLPQAYTLYESEVN